MRCFLLALLPVLLLFTAPAPVCGQILAPDAAAPPEAKEAFRLYTESASRLATEPLSALKRMQRAVSLVEKIYPASDFRLTAYYEALAGAYTALGTTLMQQRYLERAVELREKAGPPADSGQQARANASLLASDLMQLAGIYSLRGDFRHSDDIFRRAFDIYEKVYGEASLEYAILLTVQAVSFYTYQDYPRAQKLLERSLAIHEKLAKSENEISLVSPLIQLAFVCQKRGNYTAAESHYKRLLRILESSSASAKDASGGAIANFYSSLAKMYTEQGKLDAAEPLFKKAEELLLTALHNGEEKAKTDPSLGQGQIQGALSFLQMYYNDRGLLDKAQPIAERQLEIYRKQFGPESRVAASYELVLGTLLRKRGDLVRARELLSHAHKLELKAAGSGIAIGSQYQLALAEHEAGNFAESLRLVTGFFQVVAQRYGSRQAFFLPSMRLNQARLRLALHQVPQALALLTVIIDDTEPVLKLLLSGGTEQDKRRILESVSPQVHAAVELHARYAPKDARALALAFTTVLRRKGRAIDAFSEGMSALRKRLLPNSQSKLEQLSAARATLARLVIQTPKDPPPDYAQHVAELEETIRRLEEELFTINPELKAHSEVVTLDAVREALSNDGVLVEIFAYQPDDPRKPEPKLDPAARRYVAYVQRSKGAPEFADLGLVREIDGQVKKLREALSSPTRSDVKELARSLDEKVMQPLRPFFKDAKHIFLSPDGVLNLLPFGALVSEDGQYLIQRYSFTYLSSGRDLVRLRAQLESRDKTIIVANPTFGEPLKEKEQDEALSDPTTRGRRSQDLQLSTNWNELPATSEEAKTIAAVLGDAAVLAGAQATESSLKQLAGPRVLHVATHGFFLPDPHDEGMGENPLLRSGLVLAGANRRESGAEDGILTALEASGLDLGGTQLVVLSACETGLGQVQSGEGVYGLRRALVIAGAETQVMSLWQVDDNATRDLMVGFYRRLSQGKGRSESLRQAQLKLLGAADTEHPYYWASFIPAGDFRPMRADFQRKP